MQLSDSFELFEKLYALDLLDQSPKFWWPSYGSFEVVIGAILTQNSRFEKVQHSLENLRKAQLERLEAWSGKEAIDIIPLIEPSGLYRQKSVRLVELCKAIVDAFGDFETFAQEVDRDWLLSQKGIGPESADAILCYGCQREAMVVDRYTARLLEQFGFEFESYDALQEWLVAGLESQLERVGRLYEKEVDLATIYAHFHGMIVEYCKKYCRTKEADLSPLA